VSVDNPFARKPPESSLATGYQITDGGRRIDTSAEDEEKLRRLAAAVMKTIGVDPEKEEEEE